MKVKFKKSEVKEISKKLLNKISKIKNKNAKVLAFSGNLGAGKTTLTQEIAKHLGIKEGIISPTFVIMKFYDIGKNSEYFNSFKKLIHIDAYRLDSHDDLMKLGWTELVENKNNLIIVEWPERVEKCFDDNTFSVKLAHVDEETRTIEF